jgi:hypothetical protein
MLSSAITMTAVPITSLCIFAKIIWYLLVFFCDNTVTETRLAKTQNLELLTFDPTQSKYRYLEPD